MAMELIRNFSNLNKKDADIAGGKGASLGEMTQAGIPVPPGFVVLSNSFEQFIKETDLVQEIDAVLSSVDHRAIHTVEAASEKIKELILSRDMPKDIETDILKHFTELDTQYVAVRSSATAEDGMDHAWAGQLESYLNITKDGVLEKVKHCWASLFTPRAIFYRFEKGLHTTKISVAVVVQKMVNSELSGIAFSVHPVTEDYNQLIIEAGFGLGEAIVSGSVTPDSYVVEKEPRKIVDVNVSNSQRSGSQVLNEAQILELSGIVLYIEKHFGFPVDVEWVYDEGKFYIVQSRPITTLGKKMTKLVKIGTRFVAPPMFQGACLAQTAYLRDLIGDAFHHYIMRYDGVRMDAIRSEDDLIRLKPLMLAYASSPDFEKNIARCEQQIEVFKKDMTDIDAFARVYCHTIVPYFLTNTWLDDIDPAQRERIIEVSTQYRTMIDVLVEPFYKATAHIPVRPSFIFYSGDYVEGSWENFLKENNFEYAEERVERVTELKGIVAYKGNVRGIAKIILSPNDFHKLEEGDILVVPMTTPLYLPILHKAAGIVTDEGGILSHSHTLLKLYGRQVCKPCITGTRMATTVFGDGDLLEIDAVNGTVHIL